MRLRILFGHQPLRHATHKGTEDTTGLFAIRVWRRGQYLSRASIASIASSDGKAKIPFVACFEQIRSHASFICLSARLKEVRGCGTLLFTILDHLLSHSITLPWSPCSDRLLDKRVSNNNMSTIPLVVRPLLHEASAKGISTDSESPHR